MTSPSFPGATLHRQPIPGSIAGSGAGSGEVALYGLLIALAAGSLDRLVGEYPVFSAVRAAAWGGIYLCLTLLCVNRPRLLLDGARRVWPLLTLPALALASVLWSARPQQTLPASLQLLGIILFGLVMGTRLDERRLLGLLVLVLGLLALPDLGMTLGSPLGLDRNGDAMGIFAHKNSNGEIMGILTVAALALAVWGGDRRPGGSRPWAVAALCLAVPQLGLSGSRTAWMATLAACLLAVPGLLLLRLPPRRGLQILCLGGALGCFLAVAWMSTGIDLVEFLLKVMDKDPTLTGRTVLWDMAGHYLRQAPLLGHGYEGFWSDDITSDSAFVNAVMKDDLRSFHNGFLQMAVELGLVGAALSALLIGLFVWPVLRLLRRGDPAAAAFAAGLLLMVAISNFSEVALFLRHGFNLLLVSALWCRAALLAEVKGGGPRAPALRLPRRGSSA